MLSLYCAAPSTLQYLQCCSRPETPDWCQLSDPMLPKAQKLYIAKQETCGTADAIDSMVRVYSAHKAAMFRASAGPFIKLSCMYSLYCAAPSTLYQYN
ncbi:hypothetical protein XELAEV_18004509mg [Xenopus laevis]|uniref:Uncharacterized protein n=1 Tax=Xenopus laevis TaxID=8355 RepID=A0A974GZV0_XENLA|nr:hypothetical protein XELAEV_18004509mg [Xenopus laevis]